MMRPLLTLSLVGALSLSSLQQISASEDKKDSLWWRVPAFGLAVGLGGFAFNRGTEAYSIFLQQPARYFSLIANGGGSAISASAAGLALTYALKGELKGTYAWRLAQIGGGASVITAATYYGAHHLSDPGHIAIATGAGIGGGTLAIRGLYKIFKGESKE